MKKLIPAICMLLVSVMLLGTSTYAWFSMNTTATATGMKIKAIAGGSLVIGVASGGSRQTGFPERNSKNIEATFTANSVTLYDCTHDSGEDALASKLKTLTAASRKDVDVSTGKAATDKTLAYAKVGSDGYSSDSYYVDYVMYVASSTDAAITANSFTVTPSTSSTVVFKDAVSIDWYIGDAFKKTTKITSGATELLGASETVTIPAAAVETGTEAASLKITMRVYIDGNADSVKNENYSLDDISFNVTLTCNTAS